MTAENPAVRCFLKWISESVQCPKVRDVLKKRVTKVEAFGNLEGFEINIEVDGQYGQRVLEMKRAKILSELQRGFREQGGTNLKEIHFLHK